MGTCHSIWNLITLQAILDATVLQRDRFCAVVEAQDNLRIVEMPSWAGLGVVQYVCKNVMLKNNRSSIQVIMPSSSYTGRLIYVDG